MAIELLKLTGIFLIIEGYISIKLSKDQRQISQIGRTIRIIIGLYLLTI